MIYLDHNATTPLAPEVLEAMGPFLTGQFGNPSSYYQLGRQARQAVEAARHRVAELLGAQPDEILFTAGGTEADNLALRGTVGALRSRGRHIITSPVEHHAVLQTCQALEREGAEVTWLRVDGQGLVDPEEIRRTIRPDTVLISVLAANNETGVIQPIREIAALARKRGVPVHTDAVQAVGKIPVDVGELGVDLLALSAHKLYGPKGVGALYLRSGTPLAPTITGGHQEGELRAGTENVAGIVGLAEALSRAVGAMAAEAKRQAALRDHLEHAIQERLEGVRVNGAGAPRVPNTANLSFEAVDGESIILHLDLRGICAATGSACTTNEPEPSHVLLAMGLEPHVAQGAVRFSLGCSSTRGDIDRTAEALAEIVPPAAGHLDPFLSHRNTPNIPLSCRAEPPKVGPSAVLEDAPLTLTAELGRSRITLDHALEVGEQSLIELDKSVGDPVDILISGRLYAKGEVVTVELGRKEITARQVSQLKEQDVIAKLADREIQTLMREVDQKDLVIALKGTAEGLKQKILGNMSEKVRTFITEEMTFLGPMRMSEVEEVQLRVVQQVRQLEEQGKITIVGDDTDTQWV